MGGKKLESDGNREGKESERKEIKRMRNRSREIEKKRE